MKVVTNYRAAKEHKNMNYYFMGHKVTEQQANEIKSVGGKIATERNDEWFWRNWS